jgi:flagellar capping protein FliD
MEEFIQFIKDYAPSIISTISVGGVATVAGIIAKVKQGIDSTKSKMNEVLEKKDNESNEMKNQYNSLMTTIKTQQDSIDKLTQEVSKIHHE